jgi:hypothetical protein
VNLQARSGGAETLQKKKQAFVDELKSLPIAIQTQAANEQHYEVTKVSLPMSKSTLYWL